jgi:oligoendopeptidase F
MPSKPSPLPRWNLSDLFKSIDDPAIEKTLTTQLTRAKQFSKKYRGTISKARKAEEIAKILKEYESILQEAWKPEIYASLLHAADSKNPKHGALLQKTEQRGMEIGKEFLFLELELVNVDEKTMKSWIQHPSLAKYRHYLEKELLWKPHRLSEAEEKLMKDLSLTGRSAFTRLYEEELSHHVYRLPGDKKPYQQEELLDRLHDPKQNKRKQAAAAYTVGLREQLRRLTFVTNTLLQEKKTIDTYRRFESPEASRHISNEIDQATVDAMTSAVTERFDIVHDFYRFKRTILKLPKLHDYDRYAPISSKEKTVPFPQAKTIILDAFTRFSPRFAKLAQAFFDNGWIDAPQTPGKRGGAFCMFVTPDLHPYVFVNYSGNVKQVLTLAHELGHGVHASLARKQNLLHFDMPLTLAETASVFAEMITFDAMKATLTDPQERLTLLMQKIEEVFATVFRQTTMYRFEQDLHATSRTQGELTSEQISSLWRKHQTNMFGTSVTLTKDYDVWWSYISHFIHTPFYVYAYAFGELLTLSLFAEYKKRGATMVEDYLTFLEAGGSKGPDELLKPFGINLRDKAFWQGGIKLIEELVKEAKDLQKQIAK